MHSVQIEIGISIRNKTEPNRMCKFLSRLRYWRLIFVSCCTNGTSATLLNSQKANESETLIVEIKEKQFCPTLTKKEKSFWVNHQQFSRKFSSIFHYFAPLAM